MKKVLVGSMIVFVAVFVNTSIVLASSISTYKLIDDGLSSVNIPCESKTTNDNGVSIQDVNLPNSITGTKLVQNGIVIDTIVPPSDYTQSSAVGNAINNKNQVVGGYIDNSRPTSLHGSGFFWDNGEFKVIFPNAYSGAHGNAYDINNYGYAVGTISSVGGFVWREGGAMSLEGLGSGYIFPTCINDDGIIYGTVLDYPNFDSHYVHWIPLDADGNYNNGYIDEYNTGYNNNFNTNYNNGFNNGFIGPILNQYYNSNYNNGYNNNFNNGYNNGYVAPY